MTRGIPPVSDYAHWNEDAERIWYEENRYDMERPEVFDFDPYEDVPYYEEPEYECVFVYERGDRCAYPTQRENMLCDEHNDDLDLDDPPFLPYP